VFGKVSMFFRFCKNYLSKNQLLDIMAKKKRVVQFKSKNKNKKHNEPRRGVANSHKK